MEPPPTVDTEIRTLYNEDTLSGPKMTNQKVPLN